MKLKQSWIVPLLGVLSFFSFTMPTVIAQELNVAEAINQAGLQRMLSQRIAKNYILISQGINIDSAVSELDESAATFEENLFNLKRSVKTTKAKDALSDLKDNWYTFREVALSDVNKMNTIKIVDNSTSLLKSAHALVLALEQFSSKSNDKLINISGRQRMLSQRLAMYYYASNSGYNEESFREKMYKTANEFSQALVLLQKSKDNTNEINDALADVSKQWSFYKKKFNGASSAQFSPRTIKVVSESMLMDMNSITKLYETESIRKNKYKSWILGQVRYN